MDTSFDRQAQESKERAFTYAIVTVLASVAFAYGVAARQDPAIYLGLFFGLPSLYAWGLHTGYRRGRLSKP